MKSYLSLLVPFFVAFGLSAGLTPLVRKLAIQFGQVAEPREDRWHSSPTAVMGGVAIAASFYLAVLAVTVFLPAAGTLSKYLPLLICTFLVFTLGLVDDIYRLAPQTKLVGADYSRLIARLLWLQNKLGRILHLQYIFQCVLDRRNHQCF